MPNLALFSRVKFRAKPWTYLCMIAIDGGAALIGGLGDSILGVKT